MKVSDAKKILAGNVKPYGKSQSVAVYITPELRKEWRYIYLTPKDYEFMLRQLALKVVREKEKGK